nr:9050_t:CDS:2 [Entrophospora candida]
MSALNSGWKSAAKKVEKIRNKVDNIIHNYPELPKFLLGEESLPFQIGSKVSVKDYNTFLDRNESTGYKFYWNKGNVYIIEMANSDHECVISVLQECFRVPNNNVICGPIKVYGQPFHYNPINITEKMAPDVAVYPNIAYVPRPGVLHPGPPPSDTNGLPHARIICEIANAQNIATWNRRCENWMREQYVRCVVGIKLDIIRSYQGQVHRSMIAMLWTRQIPAPPTVSRAVPTLPGVFTQKWDFGTLQYNSNQATGCNGPGIPAYQVNIPISNVFWDPPIVAGAPNVRGYNITVPGTVVGNNFVIDLYNIQQEVLASQKV